MNDSNAGKNQIEIQNFYDRTYYSTLPNSLTPRRYDLRLARRLNIDLHSDVLDIACGTGEWLRAVAELGGKVSGIDLSTRAIEFCQMQMPTGVFKQGNAEVLPFENDKFNIITCLGSLEHFLAPEKALKEMIRVSSADCKFLLLVPNSGFLTKRLGLFGGTHQQDAYEHWRSIEEWESLFESVGLEVKVKWKDLHVLSWKWVSMKGWASVPTRFLQAVLLCVWPLRWQYQVYFLCAQS